MQSHLLAIPYYHKLRNIHVTLGTWRVFEGSAVGHETNYERSKWKKLVLPPRNPQVDRPPVRKIRTKKKSYKKKKNTAQGSAIRGIQGKNYFMWLNAFFWNFVFVGVKEITCSSTRCNVGVPPRTNMIGTSDCREISFSRTQSLQIPKYSHGPRELDTSQRIPNGA